METMVRLDFLPRQKRKGGLCYSISEPVVPLVPRDGRNHLQDPAVLDLIRSRYLAVRVDADSRPDLANRYEDYGWPATIVFNTDGSEIVKRQGYIPPKPMASMLQAIIDDPSPGPSILPEPQLSASQT
jgi:hypothetical protein